MASMENPKCSGCGRKLTQHRLTRRGQVYCLVLAVPRNRVLDERAEKAGTPRSPISVFDPAYKDEKAQQQALLRCPVGLLRKSPLTGTAAAEAWLLAIKGVPQFDDTALPGLENVR